MEIQQKAAGAGCASVVAGGNLVAAGGDAQVGHLVQGDFLAAERPGIEIGLCPHLGDGLVLWASGFDIAHQTQEH